MGEETWLDMGDMGQVYVTTDQAGSKGNSSLSLFLFVLTWILLIVKVELSVKLAKLIEFLFSLTN